MKTTICRLLTFLLLAFGLLATTPGQAGLGGPPPAQTINFQSDGTVAHQFFPPGMDDEGEPTPGSLNDTLNLSPAPTLTANFATDKVLVFTLTAPPGKQIRVTPVGVGTRLSFQFRTQASISGQFSPGTFAPPVWENGQGALPASLSPAQLFYTAADSNLASFMVLPVTGSFSFTKLTVTMTLPPEAVASFANHPLVQTDAYFDAFGLNTDSGPAVTFETLVAPTVTTPTHADLTEGSATLGGNVTASGTSPITQRGIVISATMANADPTSLGAGVTNAPEGGTALGVFTRSIGFLSPGTSYSYAAYATNSAGTGFTAVSTFTTPATPTGPSTASITILESGADVVATGSGSINLTALTLVTGAFGNPVINSTNGNVRTGGVGTSFTRYSGITGPSSFGSGGDFFANSGTGDMFGVIGIIGNIQVPIGYVSQAPLAGTATWNGKTISSLGLTPGTYTYTWGSGGTAGSLTVQIGPVSVPNSAPTNITLSNATIAENNAPGATIGTLAAVDADAGQEHTFELVSGEGSTDNAAFSLSGDELLITDAADFETQASYSIRVRTTDNGDSLAASPSAGEEGIARRDVPMGLSFEKVLTITITDVNESRGLVVEYESGVAITGAPVGTTFHSMGALPAELPGGENLVTMTLPGGVRVPALVNRTGVIAKMGDAFAAAGGATFRKFNALAYGAFFAELTIGSGSPAVTKATSKVACFYNGTSIELLARTGSAAPGTAMTFMHLEACAGDAQGNVFLKARTNEAGSVSTGLWVRPAGGSVKLLVKQGQTVDIGNGNQRVDFIGAFPNGFKSQAEGRVHYGEDSIITRLTMDGANAIVAIPASATGAGDWTIIAKTGDDAPGGVGKYRRIEIPSVEGTHVAFRATLVPSATVTGANEKIIVLGDEIIAREGDTAPGTSLQFIDFENPCAGGPGRGSFIATLAGASSTTKLGLWEYRNDSLRLVARKGSSAPVFGNPALTIHSITRNAHPGGANGPLFMVTLNGATRTTNTVFYAVAPDGSTDDLARTGDQFFIGGIMRPLTQLQALNYNVGNEGVARGYDRTKAYIFGSFGIRNKALISLPLEEEDRRD